MTLLSRTTLVLALALVLTAVSVAPASAARSCSIGNSRDYGTTYVTSIKVAGTSCANGRTVIRAFHRCRPGKAGYCSSRVYGYRCRESRYNRSRTQYDSLVTCSKAGGRRVWHRYTQWL